jgi:Lrp/AsnC family transcriptional regulator, leucine-responsive regulatory protein
MKRSHKPCPLDVIDASILRILVKDGRITVAEIARKINMSSPSATERVRRLEEAGVISNYTAVMAPQSIDLPVSAYLRIQPVPGKLKKVIEIIARLEEVVRCDRVTGEDCLIARAHFEHIADLEVLVDKLSSYAMVNSSIIQSTPIPYRLPKFPVKA